MKYDITLYGAVGDGAYDCTQAFADAVEKVRQAGGGTVLVPPGRFLTGTVALCSNCTLEIEPGGTIVGSPRLEDYTEFEWGHNKDRTHWHLIVARDVQNVTIRGGGTIDGSGPAFWDPQEKPGEFILCRSARRPSPMVDIKNCVDVKIRDVVMTNSPGWTCHVHDCDHTVIDGVRIYNNPLGPNTDGFDLTGVHDLVLSNCFVDTGDDAICLKTTADSRDIEHVTVTNCVLRTHCVGLKLGCNESVHDMRRVTFSNCVVHGSSRVIALYAYEGGVYEDILFSNIAGDTCVPIIQNRPIQIEARKNNEKTAHAGIIRNVTIDGFSCETDGRIMIVEADDGLVEHVRLRNIHLRYPFIFDPLPTADIAKSNQFPKHSPEARRARAAVVVDRARDVNIEGLSIQWPRGDVPAEWQFDQRMQNGGLELFDEQPHGPVPFHAVWLYRAHRVTVGGVLPPGSQSGVEPLSAEDSTDVRLEKE